MKRKSVTQVSQDGKYDMHVIGETVTKKKSVKKPKLKTYTVVNNNDPNDTFEVEAKNENDAHYEALKELGWWIAE